MPQKTRRPRRFLVALFAAAAGVVCALPTYAADEKPAAAPATKPAGTSELFELRIYTAAPGKIDALHARFREHTLRLFEKHGIRNVGYWVTTDDKGVSKLYYVIAYPDKAARETMLVTGIARDAEFLKAVAESEKDGKLTSAIESVLMTATDYSPIK